MRSAGTQREQNSNEPVSGGGKTRSRVANVSLPLTFDDAHSPALLLSHGPGGSSSPLLPMLQAKLTVNEPGDQYEQEADRVAEQIMRMPDPTIGIHSPSLRLQRKCGCGGSASSCEECAGRKVQLQRHATGGQTNAAVPNIVHNVLQAPGQPLNQSTRAFFESRLGRDFSQVRVHIGGEAAESARQVRARAYTLNNHIVFGAGEYAPSSSRGRQLLAHELAHVVQQDGAPAPGVIQRAEVDDRSCAGLTDIESDVDAKVNTEIAAARTTAGTPIDMAVLFTEVVDRLGGNSPISPMETFIEAMPATKRNLPTASLAGTKYSGAPAVNNFYMLQTSGLAHVVGSAAKIKGICVGADKLGHFFQEGSIYFKIMNKIAGGNKAMAESAGRALEIGLQGLASTGVYSNADQAANLAGAQFYKDLEAAPASFKFAIKNYITSAWNEQSNPSFYETSIAGVVWKVLLDGTWIGSFTSAGGTSTPINAIVRLTAITGGDVVGTNSWPSATPVNVEKIKNGKITQKTTSLTGQIPGRSSVTASPVTGISIDFDWEAKTTTGKGTWNSVDEQTLTGTWGIGTSRTNGGTWFLKKS